MKNLFLAVFSLFSIGAFAQNTFPSSGNVGIGSGSPVEQLEILGSRTTSLSNLAYMGDRNTTLFPLPADPGIFGLYFQQSISVFRLQYTSMHRSIPSSRGYMEFNSPETTNTTRASVTFGYANKELIRVNQNGKVRIADGAIDLETPNGYRLFVQDGILTEKVKVAIEGTANWADYVFADEYKLMPLKDVETFTKENKHLPNVPSAEEMVTNGLNVAEMDAKLLEKIEELTLYLIEQNKQIESLKEEIKILKEQKQ